MKHDDASLADAYGITPLPRPVAKPQRKWNTYALLLDHPDWLAVNKPADIASIAERTVGSKSLHQTLEEDLQQKLWIVHRLDKETSGVILFAKNELAHKTLSLAFQNHQVEKKYVGLVAGVPYPEEGCVDAPIATLASDSSLMCIHPKRGKPAQTFFKVLKKWGLLSWVEFRPISGRTHQIRLHAKHLGHPLCCDKYYGDGEPLFISHLKKRPYHQQKHTEEQPILSRLALHSHELKFDYNHTPFHIHAPLFKDMKACIQQLEKHA